MAGSVYGVVYYQQNSYATKVEVRKEAVEGSGQYIEVSDRVPGVTVTLYSESSKKGISVKTRSDGSFQINDIPNGNYKLIETFGRAPQYQGTQSASFKQAIEVTKQPLAVDPTVDYIIEKGFVTSGATKIVSLSRNVIPISISDTNSYVPCEFHDAPRILVPILLRQYAIVGNNMIKSVDGGTFGKCTEGTKGGTSEKTCPYDKYTGSGYTNRIYDTDIYDNYKQYTGTTPDGGDYTICNIADLHSFSNRWFDTPGKAQGDETGRFLIINGSSPGHFFFKEVITVQQKKDYIFTAWIMNIYRIYSGALPLFKIIVTSAAGKELFNNNVSADNPLNVTQIPTWKQIGAIIPASAIGTNTQITIQFISMGIEKMGNDYCIDDISFQELEECDLEPILDKSSIKSSILENEDLPYTITLTNQTATYIYDLILIDPLPFGTVLQGTTMNIKINSPAGNIADFVVSINSDLLSNGIDISKFIITEININQSKYIGNSYFSDLREGRLSRNLSVQVQYSIQVPDAAQLSGEKNIHNTAKYKYLSLMDSDSTVPRLVLSNEVITEVLYPKLSYEKQVSVYENGTERILKNGEGVRSGQIVAYRIVIKNQAEITVRNVTITDNLDSENLIPVYSKSSDCAKGISFQDISPIRGEEYFLACSDIEKIEGSIYNIKILNCIVQAAEIIDNNLVQGECIVRIYCIVK